MKKNDPQALGGEGAGVGNTLSDNRNTGKRQLTEEPPVDPKNIAKGSFPATYDYGLRNVAEEYDEDILQPLEEAGKPFPFPGEMAGRLLQRVVANIAAHNAGADNSLRWPIPKTLPPSLIAWCMVRCNDVRRVRLADGGEPVLAVYMPDEGIYSTREADLAALAARYNCAITTHELREVILHLRILADVADQTDETRYTPFPNGVLDWQTRELLPFSPSFVFANRVGVPYVIDAQKPDGITHEDLFAAWACNNKELERLLLAVVVMVLRPALPWNRMVMLYSPSGSNGKGTFLRLLRTIAGESTMTRSLARLSGQFGLRGIERARLVCADENNVRGFLEESESIKAIITHDSVYVDVKCKDGYDVTPRCVLVQCLNEELRTADRSESLYRRSLPVPFNARFMGADEDTSIKLELVNDPDFLAWLVRCAVESGITPETLEIPQACQELLDDFKSYNDPLRDFVADVLGRTVWDLLPFAFLFDLYKAWLAREYPSARPLGRNKFFAEVRRLTEDIDGWLYVEEHRTNGLMKKAELMVAEYSLGYPWYNGAYQGRDMVRRSKCNSFAEKYKKCLLRDGAPFASVDSD